MLEANMLFDMPPCGHNMKYKQRDHLTYSLYQLKIVHLVMAMTFFDGDAKFYFFLRNFKMYLSLTTPRTSDSPRRDSKAHHLI